MFGLHLDQCVQPFHPLTNFTFSSLLSFLSLFIASCLSPSLPHSTISSLAFVLLSSSFGVQHFTIKGGEEAMMKTAGRYALLGPRTGNIHKENNTVNAFRHPASTSIYSS